MKSLLFLFKCGAVLLAFVSLGERFLHLESTAQDDLTAALDQNRHLLHSDLAACDAALTNYHQSADNPNAPVDTLRAVHRRARRAYKRVEQMLAYAQPATVTRHLNGAPLPKTEPGVPEVVVLPPGGLQTLDELVFEPEIDRAAIKKLTHKLLGDYRRLQTQMKGLRLQHRHVFESAQQQIVRLFTLGLTGFDTPASGAALPEARTAFAVIASSYTPYAPAVAQKDADLDRRIRGALDRGSELLATDDFEGFDRLTFLRDVCNPLTASLPRAQRLLGIESAADIKGLPSPVDPTAEYLFDADYLDADYFANLNDVSTADERLALGRLLFFDPILSNDLTASCATCHQPELAFTDGYAKSLSVDGDGTLQRNSPTLVNSVYAEKYFYDLREEFLERQVKHVVLDAHEFATDFVAIEERLRQSDDYIRLFAAAFPQQPDYQLSKWSISDALSRYVASLQGNNSAFDRYARGETAEISEQVRLGFNVFMGKGACGTCHFAPTFSGLVPPYYQESESEVLGVPATAVWENATVDPDPGRIANTRPEDEAYFNHYAFKTPTVRNASVTAPYMHNGVYQTLEEVMDFYNRGGGQGIGIHIEYQTLPFASLELEQAEIDGVIAFMRSLEDYRHLDGQPTELPAFTGRPEWNKRPVGGLSRK